MPPKWENMRQAATPMKVTLKLQVTIEEMLTRANIPKAEDDNRYVLIKMNLKEGKK